MTDRPQPTKPKRPAKSGARRRWDLPKRRWLRILLLTSGGVFVLCLAFASYLWVSYGRMIDARLGGEQRAIPRIFGRPFELRTGRALEPGQLIQRLNDVGYAERPKAEEPGEFSIGAGTITVVTRPVDKTPSQIVKV